MPYIYVYSPSDFVGGIPAESSSGSVSVTLPYTMTLKAGAVPTAIEISDNDTIFDEVDASQVLKQTVTIDGATYTAGAPVHSAYDLINTTTGLQVTTIHFTGDGNNSGAVQGLVSTQVLTAGQSYSFNVKRTSHMQYNSYGGFVSCFTTGTLIRCETGEIPVEQLRPGDAVVTADGQIRPIRLVERRRVCVDEMRANPALRPVRITAGAMGPGVPRRDLLVSRQHRMLVQSRIARDRLGETEVLVAAIRLTQMPGIFVDEAVEDAEYFHLILDRHEVVFAEGAPSESFLARPQAIAAMTPEARAELLTLFPALISDAPDAARAIPSGADQKWLIARHAAHNRSMVGAARQ